MDTHQFIYHYDDDYEYKVDNSIITKQIIEKWGKGFYHKEDLSSYMDFLISGLFIKFYHRKVLKRLNYEELNYRPTMGIYLKKDVYTQPDKYFQNNNVSEEYQKHFLACKKRFNLTATKVTNTILLLEKAKVITVEKGKRYFSKKSDSLKTSKSILTQVSLRHPFEWSKALLNNFTLPEFLSYYSRLEDFALEYSNEDMEAYYRKFYSCGVFVKTSRKKTIPVTVSPKERATMIYINSLFTGDLYKYSYVRIFLGSRKGGGRFFNSFNNGLITGAERKSLLRKFNYAEVDLPNFNLQAFYYLTYGKFYNGDFYEDLSKDIQNLLKVKSDPITLRSLAKKILTVCFNSEKDTAMRWIAVTLKEYSDKEVSTLLSVGDVYRMVRLRFAPLQNFLFKKNYKLLQYIESEVLKEVLIKMVDKSLLPLSVYDSVLIPREYEKEFEVIQKEEFESKLKKIRKDPY